MCSLQQYNSIPACANEKDFDTAQESYPVYGCNSYSFRYNPLLQHTKKSGCWALAAAGVLNAYVHLPCAQLAQPLQSSTRRLR